MNIFLDDTRNPNSIGLVNSEWHICRTVEEVKFYLRMTIVENMSLDHDLGCDEDDNDLPTGYDLLCWMEEKHIWPTGEIRVHSANPVGAAKMRAVIKRWKNNQRGNL